LFVLASRLKKKGNAMLGFDTIFRAWSEHRIKYGIKKMLMF